MVPFSTRREGKDDDDVFIIFTVPNTKAKATSKQEQKSILFHYFLKIKHLKKLVLCGF